uniref:Tyrosine 3-monooxygenase n=1 Tax=Ciona intestinalis TaxID=7719 RepID=Q5ZNC6_CIOIN|nr:tyrosine 3-monooxygenase [Ciona intestinalis]CAG25417.1 tyrosine 3-monooxygenase [Ciona intestinalis]|eukprot:NP_001027967.1 tyrosine 3-monooxygenase [Ciona intestinalis]
MTSTGRRGSLIRDAENAEKENASSSSSKSGFWKKCEIVVTSAGNTMSQICEKLKNEDVIVSYIETRNGTLIKNVAGNSKYKFLITCIGNDNDITTGLKRLESIGCKATIVNGTERTAEWFPRHVTELELCRGTKTDYEPDKDSNHPGFNDPVYVERRNYISNTAHFYKHGTDIPTVDYTNEDRQTWSVVYKTLKRLHATHACKVYKDNFQRLEKECGYSPNKIPQLQTVSEFLKEQTGFKLQPAPGIITPRDFLASLAFKVFQCTQYIRHPASPMHSPEPDCCHELIGHIPMLLDPTFALYSQQIGLASLGVSDSDITKLAALYWFTVEFGLCKENNVLKAYGAGLMSSYGELQHALSDVPMHLPLQAERTCLQPYEDSVYQPIYFVSESFDEAFNQVRAFSQHCTKRGFDITYNENDGYIQTVPYINL